MASKDESFMLVSLKEPKAKKLAQVLSNETSTKLLEYLTTNGAGTETEIAKALAMPLSTVHYNLKQLVQAKLLLADEYHYSKKGREVLHYKLAKKYIIIAPQEEQVGFLEKLREFLPAVLVVAGLAIALKVVGFLNGTLFAKAGGVADAFMPSRALSEAAPTSYNAVAAPQALDVAASTAGGVAADTAMKSAKSFGEEAVRNGVANTAANASNATFAPTATVVPSHTPSALPVESSFGLSWFSSNEFVVAFLVGSFTALLLVAFITWLRERRQK